MNKKVITLTLEQWKEILDAVIPNSGNIFEQIKRKVEERDKGTYQRWKKTNFSLRYLFKEQDEKIHIKINFNPDHQFDVLPNVSSYKLTLLHIAVLNGRLDIVEALSKNGADVEVKDSNGDTPLHKAAFWGYSNIVNALLENGADVKVKKNGKTPLHSAATGGHLKIVQALLKNKADVNVTDNYGNTPLHNAVDNGHLEIVEALLEKGADVKVKNSNGETPLHSAATGGHLKIVQALLKNKADVNVTDNYGNTPLHKAIFRGHLDTVKTAFIDRLEIVEALLENGADINITDKHDYAPLFLAHRWKHEVIVNSIVKHIAKLEAIDSYVSKDNLQFINASEEMNNNYLQHLRNCKKEVQMIKERNGSLYNFLRENDVNKMLGIWKKNENVRNEFDNEESLKKLYPEYAHILINKARYASNNNNKKQESKLPVVVASELAASGLTSGMGVAVDAFCLLAGGIIYHFSQPSNSLQNIDAEVAMNQGQEL
ncbi:MULTISPECIES: ankyrin repeat domain-containing protein [unclassified Wolbachia]|uniref:ankyrin repeat domain-containing protein n=1 Tax=unclassified Wolbachia TaxID=2640676 RepID=UPI0022305066|nr:ankyrin repeat domain-containing protein [Wolbachia endosymbiont (group A) of Endotricha flammealis]